MYVMSRLMIIARISSGYIDKDNKQLSCIRQDNRKTALKKKIIDSFFFFLIIDENAIAER